MFSAQRFAARPACFCGIPALPRGLGEAVQPEKSCSIFIVRFVGRFMLRKTRRLGKEEITVTLRDFHTKVNLWQ